MGTLSTTKAALSKSTVAKYVRAIRETPKEVLTSRHLLFPAVIYAMCGVPQTWDQGSSSGVPSLPSFQKQFGLDSGADAKQIGDFVSIIYVGYTIGAAGSYFLNNRLGRLWAYRLYATIWIVGQLIATFSPNLTALYAARIIAGIGIGSITCVSPIALVEIAPQEIRGLITTWYPVVLNGTLMVANFCVLGLKKHVPPTRLQYQTAWFAPCIWMFLCIIASFFLDESPRWLMLKGRREEAIEVFVRLRGLPADHPRVANEIQQVQDDIDKAYAKGAANTWSLTKEMFTKASNLRRLQQIFMSYALAQLSGANSITSYFIPIMKMVGNEGMTTEDAMFLSGMYGLSKLVFVLIASFFFIDALGRRKSLFVGILTQMCTHVYIGVFIKYNQEGNVTMGASHGAVAALFFHAFGYAVGLLVLPYIFGSELWPNHMRSYGTALGATFHWIFIYAIKFSIPEILDSMDNWGAFIFFAGWCFLAAIYVFFTVPEVAGMSMEQIDSLFEGKWYTAYKQAPHLLEQPLYADEESGSAKDVEIGDMDKAEMKHTSSRV